MKYSQKVVNKANFILEQRREKAEKDAEARHNDFLDNHPEFEEIEAEIIQTGADVLKVIQGSENLKNFIDSLKKKNLEYQRLKKEFLKSNGYKEDYLDIHLRRLAFAIRHPNEIPSLTKAFLKKR